MTRRFASGDSSVDITNLQLTFWRLAVEQFERILKEWRTSAVDEGEPEPMTDYDHDSFVIDAATTLILAGTSISELIGQNVEPQRAKTPHLRPAYRDLVTDPIPAKVEDFFAIYDALRHFGPAKHRAVDGITPETLCAHLHAAQSIWRDVLDIRGEVIGDNFQYVFEFKK